MGSEFISKAGYSDLVKLSIGTINGWMQRHWIVGNEYVVIGHTALINVEKATQWISQHGRPALDPAATELESGYIEKGRCASRKPLPVTRTQKLTSPARSNAANG